MENATIPTHEEKLQLGISLILSGRAMRVSIETLFYVLALSWIAIISSTATIRMHEGYLFLTSNDFQDCIVFPTIMGRPSFYRAGDLS